MSQAIFSEGVDQLEARDYMRAIEGGDTALHIYLKDDKEWWLAHNPEGEYPGAMNGPWLFWHTYPTGPWVLDFCTREILNHHVDELYYIDYYGEESHSVHDVTPTPISEAPEFVRSEFE